MAEARTRDPALWVVAAAGGFLVWRAIFGRGLGRLALAVAGLALLRRALAGGRRGARGDGAAWRAARATRTPEVVEVKSPSELEPGVAAASPRPTYSNRVDRGPEVERQGGAPGGEPGHERR